MDPGNFIPLASIAQHALSRLAAASGSAALRALDGPTLLGERAMRAGWRIPGRASAGGGCRLFEALGDKIALNLARSDDREMLPALFEDDRLDINDDAAIAACVRRTDAHALLTRGRSMGLAIAAEREPWPALEPAPLFGRNGAPTLWTELASGPPAAGRRSVATRGATTPGSSVVACGGPRVVDLSALWAGPLAAHLLWLAGAEVVKVESRSRPDAMRGAAGDFYALINQGKATVAIDLADGDERGALLSLIASSDIVIEAARPRALRQFGIDADRIVRDTPGLVWISITAHGATGEAAGWVGFGDDCSVSGGLSAALRSATGCTGFVGDALADPLTGVFASLAAWEAWTAGRGARLELAMSHVVARCLAAARHENQAALQSCLRAWQSACGQPFPNVTRRAVKAGALLIGGIQEYIARTTRGRVRPYPTPESRRP
jgi:CoA-transferase family III